MNPFGLMNGLKVGLIANFLQAARNDSMLLKAYFLKLLGKGFSFSVFRGKKNKAFFML